MEDLTKLTPTELLKRINDTKNQHEALKKEIVDYTIQVDELEKKQDWCGGALTRTAEGKIREVNVDPYNLVQYAVPFKFSNAESHLVVNWTLGKHDTIDKEFGWLERSYAPPLTEQEKSVERKLINTEKFHLEKCVQCRAHRNYLAKTK